MKYLLILTLTFSFMLAQSKYMKIKSNDKIIQIKIKEQTSNNLQPFSKESINNKKTYVTSQGHTFNSDSYILVKFQKDKDVNIEDFEKKYGLKLTKKMKIGYYIFKPTSQKDILDIINEILTNEKDIKSIKPNWRYGVKPL